MIYRRFLDEDSGRMVTIRIQRGTRYVFMDYKLALFEKPAGRRLIAADIWELRNTLRLGVAEWKQFKYLSGVRCMDYPPIRYNNDSRIVR